MREELCGASVRYEIYGQGERKICLLHGWGGGVESFAGLIAALAPQYTFLVPEFPGHGQSSEPPEPWSVTEYTEMTAALIAKCGFAGCGVIAHSFGARVAILLAAKRPALVDRMLLTGAAGLKTPASAQKTARQKRYSLFKSLVSMPIVPKGLAARAREALVQRYGSADYKALTPSMRATFNRVIAQDLRAELGNVRAPVFLFWGADDDSTPLWMGQTMEREIPDAALHVESGCGHFAYLERQDAFVAIARAFFPTETRQTNGG